LLYTSYGAKLRKYQYSIHAVGGSSLIGFGKKTDVELFITLKIFSNARRRFTIMTLPQTLIRISDEERELMRFFGEKYLRYRDGRSKLIPFLY